MTVEERRERVLELLAAGVSRREAAKRVGVGSTTVQRIIDPAYRERGNASRRERRAAGGLPCERRQALGVARAETIPYYSFLADLGMDPF